MKVFGKLLAILASIMTLGVVLLWGFFWVVEFLSGNSYAIPDLFYLLLANGPVCLMKLACSASLIFLIGRKKGKAIPEVLILLMVLLVIPVVSAVGSYLGDLAYSLINAQQNGMGLNINILQILLGIALRLGEADPWYTAATSLFWIVDYVKSGDFIYLLERLPMDILQNFDYTAQILTLIACGISMGLLVKGKKKTEMPAEAEEDVAPEAPIVAEEPPVAEESPVAEPVKKQAVKVVAVKRVANKEGE